MVSPSPTYGASGLPQALVFVGKDLPFVLKVCSGRKLIISVNIWCIFGTVPTYGIVPHAHNPPKDHAMASAMFMATREGHSQNSATGHHKGQSP